jgi:uncharacterized membrane protein
VYPIVLYPSGLYVGDNSLEYYYQLLTINRGYIDLDSSGGVGSMLSVIALAPVYHFVTGLSLLDVTKLVYPFFNVLVSIIIFTMYVKIFSIKIAYPSTLIFLFTQYFFTGLVLHDRVIIALFLISTLFTLIFCSEPNNIQKISLIIILLLAIPVSHYGLADLLLILVLISFVLFYMVQLFYSKFLPINNFNMDFGHRLLLKPTFLLIILVSILSWYIFISNGELFNSMVTIAEIISNNISEIFNISTRDATLTSGIGADFSKVTYLGQFYRIVQTVLNLLIILGFLYYLKRFQRPGFGEYKLLIASFLTILMLCIVIPFFSAQMGISRVYQFALVMLSPLIIIGVFSFRFFIKSLKIKTFNKNINYSGVLIGLLVITLLIFSSGIVYELTNSTTYGDIPKSPLLAHGRVDISYFTKAEINGAEWVGSKMDNNNYDIYADFYSKLLLSMQIYEFNNIQKMEEISLQENSSFFERKWNLEKNSFYTPNIVNAMVVYDHINRSRYSSLVETQIIYNNEYSIVRIN